MDQKDWIKKVQQLAQGENPLKALELFMQHKEEALDMFFGEKACAATTAATGDSLFARDTREIAKLVAKWSAYALPKDEAVLGIEVDMSQPDQAPLVTARTEGGEIFLFDVTEGSRVNADHKEACMHVEASWADWQDEPDFVPLFCSELTAALTKLGLPVPAYIC